jgi:N-acetyl-gamma-glutamyl-phosphate reductase
MIRVSVVGASGYTGGELLRLLTQHPEVSVSGVTSEQSAGKPLTALFPSLSGFYDLELQPFHPERTAEDSDLVFVALPHQAAMEPVARLMALGKRVIDLSADYRMRDPKVHAQWYGSPHTQAETLGRAVYGLSEIHRESIKKADLVANPGCYPTGAALGLIPLIQEGIIDLDGIRIDSKSGLSGAGRGLSLACHFPEANEGFEAYNVGTHRHTPEIEQEISLAAGREVRVCFIPHRLPINRGILTTITARPNREIAAGEITGLFQTFYGGDFFVRVLREGLPNVRQVRGSNFCDVGAAMDTRTGTVVVITAIDNLGKGAAGQAVQNMNLMMGFEETSGLRQPGIFP